MYTKYKKLTGLKGLIGMLFTFFVSTSYMHAQCNSPFNLGPDTALCVNQNLSLLIPNIYDTYSWQNNSMFTNFLVSNPGTYYCQTTLITGNNLVNNGNFQQGNTGFTTNYTYYPIADVFGPQASYGIINNANTWFNPFNPCTDHTSGNGNMMVVDGSAFNGGNDAIWCQNIAVQAGQKYRFAYWIQSVTNSNILANIRVKINGVTVNTQLAPFGACIWQEREIIWTSNLTGNASFCLYDLELAGNGNDFALDDISLTLVCEYSDTIVVSAAVSDTLMSLVEICPGDSVFLQNAWRSVPGTYYDVIVGSVCQDYTATQLSFGILDTIQDQVEICPGDSIFLEGAWQTQPGVYYDFVNGTTCDDVLETSLMFSIIDTLFSQVEICFGDSAFLAGAWRTQAGVYYDFVNGTTCDDVLETALIFSSIDTIFNQIEICPGDSVVIGNDWQSIPGFYFQFVPGLTCDEVLSTQLIWSTLDTTTLVAEICQNDSVLIAGSWRKNAGVFYKQIPGNGCDEIEETVLIVKPLPIANAGNDVTVSYEQIVSLNANNSSAGSSFLWSTADSLIANTPIIDVEVYSQVQNYYLQVSLDGCINFDTLTVYGLPLNLMILVPNAFSPNADGINDVFRVLNREEFQEITIKIYNRWGELIFFDKGENPFWSGINAKGASCPIGTYTFYIEALPFGLTEEMKLSGTLTIIR